MYHLSWTLFGHETELLDIVMGNAFRKNSAWFGRLGFKSRFFLIYQPTTINEKSIVITMLMVCTEKIKKNKHD